jgi:hypothetical protein
VIGGSDIEDDGSLYDQRRQEEKRFIASPEKDAKFGKRY